MACGTSPGRTSQIEAVFPPPVMKPNPPPLNPKDHENSPG
jgi:hypothetical protein